MALNESHSLAAELARQASAIYEILEAVALLCCKYECCVILPSKIPITPEALDELRRTLPLGLVVEHRTQTLRRPGSNVALGAIDILSFKPKRVEDGSAIDVVVASSQAVLK